MVLPGDNEETTQTDNADSGTGRAVLNISQRLESLAMCLSLQILGQVQPYENSSECLAVLCNCSVKQRLDCNRNQPQICAVIGCLCYCHY